MKFNEALHGVAVAARVKEPSSWAGAAVILQGVAYLFPQWSGIILAVSALLGAVAVKLPEAGEPGAGAGGSGDGGP